MALLDSVKRNAVSSIFIGVGAVVVAPVLLPVLASIGRPLARGALKGGLLLYEKGRELAAEAGEVLEDLLVEAKAEIAQERHGAAEGAGVVGASARPEAAEPGATANSAATGGETTEEVPDAT